ncbi:MAG TPA: NUDIX domain-containing protein [Candidatus Dormibacteraeota bacterium]|nr:NUDIX domain-containing protein [Candidatus Dormibacteraeota bacterium]
MSARTRKTPPPTARLQPNTVVAVDVILFTVRLDEPIHRAWQVLLVKREDTAFAGNWSFPGVLVRADESFDGAARRALQTKAGLDAANWYLEQLGTFGAPDRDSRGRVVSVAHLALERSDELSLAPGGGIMRADWVPVRGLPAESLAFDHADMLRVAANRAQAKLRYSWLAFQLLPETVTLPELRAVYAAILDPALLRLNTGNFKKAFSPLFASGVLVHVGRRASIGRVGRPGDLYRFTGPVMGTWARELPWHDTIPGDSAAE